MARAPAIAFLLVAAGGPLLAQQPSDSLQLLSAFADSVRHSSDVASLTSLLETARDDRAGGPAWREARKGWIAFRLGQLEDGRGRLDEAIRYFDEAVYREKDLAIGWVGLAETKLLLEQRGAVVKATMHQRDGDYYENAALGHLASALHAKPEYPAAVALLSRLLIEFDSPDFPPDLVEAIQLASAHDRNGPVPQLLLGRYLRKRRDYPGARAAFGRFAELGGDAGLADIELSRISFMTGQTDLAISQYMIGASVGDSLGRRAFRRDLAWFASPGELQAFDSLPRDSLKSWITLFWARRDAANLRPEGDRLKEHLRRWWFVQDHFRLVGRRGGARFNWGVSGVRREFTKENEGLGAWVLFEPGTLPESDPRALGVDDRGAVYMRHGEPDERASGIGSEAINVSDSGRSPLVQLLPGGCGAANESWKYELPTGPIILHFCSNEALGTVSPSTLVSMLPLDPVIIGARAGMDVRFGLMELDILNFIQTRDMMRRGGGRSSQPRINQEAASQLGAFGQASIKVGLTTDSHPLDYDHDLEPTVQIYGLSRSAGTGRALVVFALRGDRIEPQTRDGRLFYPVKIRVTAVDSAKQVTRTMDTLRLFLSADTLSKDAHLYGTLDVPLPSGTYYVRVLLEQPGRSAAGAVGQPEVAVPGEAGTLSMSDLVLGRNGSGLVWQHQGRSVFLNPLESFREGASLELYYEVEGTRPRVAYKTTLNFTRIQGRGGRGKDQVSLGFTDQSEGTTLVVQRSIGLNELGAGRYLLSVSITDEDAGRTLTRQRLITVVRND